MENFEFTFTLFGLLLGLALTEPLAGIARALKSRHRVRIGWPTALLGLTVSCDVVTFWMYGWSLRDEIKVSWPILFGGFLVTAVYYICAAMIFPDSVDEDHEAHFDRVKPLVLGGMVLCNAALLGFVVHLIGVEPMLNGRAVIITWSLFPVAIAAALIKDRRVVIACLLWLIALYPLSAFWH